MTEARCVVAQCCCGCTLRTGSMIIAVLTLVASIINIANGVVGASQYAGGWVAVILGILTLIVAILLIIGIQKEKRNFIMIWVWVMIVSLVIFLINGIAALFSHGLGVFIAALIYILLEGYCVVVVRSYALTLGGGVGSPA